MSDQIPETTSAPTSASTTEVTLPVTRAAVVQVLLAQPDLIDTYGADISRSFVDLTHDAAVKHSTPSVTYTRAITLHETITQATQILDEVIDAAADDATKFAAFDRHMILLDLLSASTNFIASVKANLATEELSTSIVEADRTMKRPADYTDDDLYVTRVTTTRLEPIDGYLFSQTYRRETHVYVEHTPRDGASSSAVTKTRVQSLPHELVDDACAKATKTHDHHPVISILVFVATLVFLMDSYYALSQICGAPSSFGFITSILVGVLTTFMTSRAITHGRDVIQERNLHGDSGDESLPLEHRLAYRDDIIKDLVKQTLSRMNASDETQRHLPMALERGLRALSTPAKDRETLREDAARAKNPFDAYEIWDEHEMLATRAWLIELLELLEVVLPDRRGMHPSTIPPRIGDELHEALTLLMTRYEALLEDPEKARKFMNERIKREDIARRVEEKKSSAIDKVVSRYGTASNTLGTPGIQKDE